MKPVKLLFLLNRLVLSGQSIDVIPLAHHLSQQKFDIHILYGNRDNDEEDALYLTKKYPVPVIKKINSLGRNISPVKDIRAFFFVYKYIRKFRPAIIHTHGAKAGFIGRIAAKIAGVPVVVHTFHGNLFKGYYNGFVSSVVGEIEKMLSGISTKIIALSNEQRYELTQLYKIAPINKVDIIHLGLDENEYLKNATVKRADFRNKYNLQENVIAIGIVGRMAPIKNHQLFIEIIASLLFLKKELCFFVIGDGELKVKLQETLERYSIKWSDNESVRAPVVFTSWVPDVTEVLHGLDIVALTSLNEGTPVSLIEAQLCGKPVVATNVGGVKDTLLNGETGFLIDDFSKELFVEKINLLAKDGRLRTEMGKKAHEFALQKFSKQREVKETIELYLTCLKAKGIHGV